MSKENPASLRGYATQIPLTSILSLNLLNNSVQTMKILHWILKLLSLGPSFDIKQIYPVWVQFPHL